MKALGLLLILLLMVSHLPAQDTHYWTQAFGTRSALLGGAVVGGTNDNTTLYYNPAALAFIDTASVSINANLYQVENIKIKNALGQRADFKSSNIATIPLLVTGMFETKNPRLKIGYGFVSPVNFDFKATARFDGFQQIVDDSESPGDEEFIGQQSISTSVHEVAAAIAIGYKLNPKFAIGITNLFTVRTANYTKATLSRFFLNNADRQLVTATFLQNFNYYHVRYAAKIAAAYKTKRFDAGLTVTTPGLGFMGKGTVAADLTGTAIKYNGRRQDLTANDRQEKLKTKYLSPYAVSGGLNVHFRRSLLAFAIQYNGQEGIYDIMQAKPAAFVRPADLYPSLGSDNFLRVKTAAESVLNIAVGYEHSLNERISLLFSLRNNQSYYDEALAKEKGIKPDLTSWNIYHLVGGCIIRKNRSSISLGLQLSVGNDPYKEQDGNYSKIAEENFLQGATTITQARYSAIGFLLGYNYNFRKF
ncbi:outer membrane protein transport protein [Chitinophaga barathri]|uniref:Aromatic hydrocarbon degradation protein n=1 Tax=Chitinophaga barathri TaxID=1647451 RepID=A0A3N4MCT0_9BACT|nr:outer membrane protein transport protein [Chitinophaga barathri]RPD41511.1 hypothetical protein EG028_09360 [Chitinophaga barathri]